MLLPINTKNKIIYPHSTTALKLHFCANQPQAQKKPRLPTAKAMVIIQIACEQRLNMVI